MLKKQVLICRKISVGSLDDGYLYVLLANTNNADAGFVTGRIKDAGYSYEMIDGDVDGGAYGD